jgi:hypothetical protein
MADKTPEPTQKTPKGLEIPVPTRDEFLRNMDKIAKTPGKPEQQSDESNKTT